MSRSELIDRLSQADVGTSVHYRPLHLHSYYVKSFDFTPDDLPVASAAFDEILSLPIFPGMTDQEVELVVGTIRSAAS